MLIVSISLLDIGNGKEVSTVTYDGNSMTEIQDFSGAATRVQIFSLVAPPVGTANVQINISGGQQNKAAIGAISFTGADQSTPTEGFGNSSGEGSSSSINVNSESGDLVVDAIGTDKNNLAAGAGQTDSFNYDESINTWRSSTGGFTDWETATNWTLGVPASDEAVVVPTNPADAKKTECRDHKSFHSGALNLFL